MAEIFITGLAELPDLTLLDDCALAKILGVHPRTIRRMSKRGELPPPIRQAGKSVWVVGKVKGWILARAEKVEQSAKRELERLEKLGS